jgi:hypothetical protein
MLPIAEIDDQARVILVQVLGYGLGAAVLIWCISFAIRSANKRINPPQTRKVFPPPTSLKEDLMAGAGGIPGPGRFLISGVDKATGFDVTEHVVADSAANARVKAELKGVVVTEVRRE